MQQLSPEQQKELQEKLAQMSPEQIKELQKQQCIFCKIADGEIPSKTIFEDDRVRVVLDINPASPGHCLIIPKEHAMILPQLPDEYVRHMFQIAKQTSHAQLRGLKVEGTSWMLANGAIAGQRAQHAMLHLIPRKENDGVGIMLPTQESTPEQRAEMIGRLKPTITKLLGVSSPGSPSPQPPSSSDQQPPSDAQPSPSPIIPPTPPSPNLPDNDFLANLKPGTITQQPRPEPTQQPAEQPDQTKEQQQPQDNTTAEPHIEDQENQTKPEEDTEEVPFENPLGPKEEDEPAIPDIEPVTEDEENEDEHNEETEEENKEDVDEEEEYEEDSEDESEESDENEPKKPSLDDITSFLAK